MFDIKQTPQYQNRANVLEVGEKEYLVLQYLLPPKYSNYANDPERGVILKDQQYVYFREDEIKEDLEGFKAPHIMDGYSYPMNGENYPYYTVIKYGKVMKPYPAQINSSRYLLGADGKGHEISKGRGCHLHNEMRVGKSLSALWAMDCGLLKGIFNKVLIVSPTTVMQSTWAKELLNHFHSLAFTIKRGVKRDRFSTTSIDIINCDGLTAVIEKETVDEYDLIIYDEATAVKTSTTARWKKLNKYLSKRPSCKIWLLTGAGLAQSPLAAYGQAKLVAPHLVPRSFTAWREMTMYNTWGHEWKPKAHAHEICAQALQPCLRWELKDIADIPKHTYEYIICEKSAKQARMYSQMARDFVAEFSDEGMISAVNAASKMSKMLQILTGVVYDADGTPIEVDASPRLEALTDLIDQLPEDQPVVIFAEWTHTINMLMKYLTPKYKKVECINGQTSHNDRLAIEQRIQNNETKVVICHPTTTAFGLDFSSTNVCVWYCVTFKNELYLQGSERIRNYASRSRGFDKFIIYHLISDEIEQIYFKNLIEKADMQGRFFNVVRGSLQSRFVV